MPDEAELIPEALIVQTAERLRLLGQPVRLRLIELLAHGCSTPQELSETTGLSQQNVSKHLLTLYRGGIVTRRQEGARVIYTLTANSAIPILNLTLESVTRHLYELSKLASHDHS